MTREDVMGGTADALMILAMMLAIWLALDWGLDRYEVYARSQRVFYGSALSVAPASVAHVTDGRPVPRRQAQRIHR